ncbi:ribonucleotide reductase small subunit [Pectobacterium phage POP12]|nr:ribonucleotide reductase small subunit [Pectobacterium phage POP12]
MSIINTKPVNHLDQYMFFGEDLGIARFESQKHSVFESLTEKQLSFFWRPEEIDLSMDRIQYANMPEHQKKIFDSNLQYQTLLDSVQGRAPTVAFLGIVSDVSLENWITTWAFSETIHSRSYTHIQRNLHIDPSSQFDAIVENEAIMKRSKSITEYYDRLIEESHHLKALEMENESDPYTDLTDAITKQRRKCKIALYLCMHAVNALEAIRFYVSFSFTFNFAEMGIMEGNAKIMRLIARDEALHMKGTQSIIRLMQMSKDDPEMAEIAYQYEEEASKIFMDAVDQEIEWARHLFDIGDVDNLSLNSMTKYIHHLADVRMRAVGLNSPYGITPTPYPWMKKHLNSENVQVAPQESEISSYLVGQIDANISDTAYENWRNEFMPSGKQV